MNKLNSEIFIYINIVIVCILMNSYNIQKRYKYVEGYSVDCYIVIQFYENDFQMEGISVFKVVEVSTNLVCFGNS